MRDNRQYGNWSVVVYHEFFAFLFNRVTITFFHAEGNCMHIIEVLNILEMTDLMPLHVSRTMWLDKSSEPMAVDRRTVCSACSNSQAETRLKKRHGVEGTINAVGDEDMGTAANSGAEGVSH